MKKTAQGQSLNEYSLIGALVVVLGIGALTFMGNNVSSLLGSTIQQRKVPTLVANVNFPTRPDSKDIVVPLKRPNGEVINLVIENYPTTQTQNDLMTGDEGSTRKKYAELMQVLAQQLYDEKIIDDTQYQALRNIANHGIDSDKTWTQILQRIKNLDTDNPEDEGNPLDRKTMLFFVNIKGKIYDQLDIFYKRENSPKLLSSTVSKSINSDIYEIDEEGNQFKIDKSIPNEILNNNLHRLILDLSSKIVNGNESIPKFGMNVFNETKKLSSIVEIENETSAFEEVMPSSTSMCFVGKGSIAESGDTAKDIICKSP